MSGERAVTEHVFLKDVAKHQMTVLRDDGLYRHVRFKKPDSGDMRFDLVTWPGYLAYTGDMGTFVFSRITDMFEFFRSPPRDGEVLPINLGYWHEKADAEDRSDGIRRFSPDKFIATVKQWLTDAKASREVRQDVETEVISLAHDGEHAAMTAAIDYRHDSGFEFTDFWEADCTEYTFRFVWCCYALVWGIRQYDAARIAA